MAVSASSSSVPRPPGSANEGVGEVVHPLLPLVHRVDFDELGESPMGDLAGEEPSRDHADDLPAGGEGGVGEVPISPDAPPPYTRRMPEDARCVPSAPASSIVRASLPLDDAA